MTPKRLLVRTDMTSKEKRRALDEHEDRVKSVS